MAYEKIIVLFPTRREAEPFLNGGKGAAEVRECGIGAVECAARTAGTIATLKPDLIILAGIAGAYPGSGIGKGETVLVTRENLPSLGAIRHNDFFALPKEEGDSSLNFYESSTPVPKIFRKVHSDTVETAGTPFRSGLLHARIENMEGAGFFAVCNALGMDCAELRCISNYTDESRHAWIVDEAAAILAKDLEMFIKRITETT